MSLFGEENTSQNTHDSLSVEEQGAMKNLVEGETTYSLITDIREFRHLGEQLIAATHFCFDTETSGLEEISAELLGLSFAIKPGEAWYVALPSSAKDRAPFIEELKRIFSAEKPLKIAHNIKFDMSMLYGEGVAISSPTFDTMIAHYLLEPDQRHNMDALSETYLGYSPIPIETLIGKKGKTQKSMADLEPGEIKDYACEDADVTLQLYHHFAPKIDNGHLKELFYKIEMPLTTVLMKMERTGICIDEKALHDFSGVLNDQIIALQEEVIHLVGVNFNLDSPKQLGEVLFDKLQIDPKAKKQKQVSIKRMSKLFLLWKENILYWIRFWNIVSCEN
jgi:DNA polymerase I